MKDTHTRAVVSHLRGLLPPQGHLGRHHPLPLHHQQAVGALTVPPAAEALVSLQTGHHAVVATPGALRRAAQLPLVPRAHGAGRRFVVALVAVAVVFKGAGAERRRAGAAGTVDHVVALRLQTLNVDFELTTV